MPLFLATIPKTAILVAWLNASGIAIPGQGVDVSCTDASGRLTVAFLPGDSPIAQVAISATSCAIPRGYYPAAW